jgi:hypothetical protein
MGSFGENPRLMSGAAARKVPWIGKRMPTRALIGFVLRHPSC